MSSNVKFILLFSSSQNSIGSTERDILLPRLRGIHFKIIILHMLNLNYTAIIFPVRIEKMVMALVSCYNDIHTYICCYISSLIVVDTVFLMGILSPSVSVMSIDVGQYILLTLAYIFYHILSL